MLWKFHATNRAGVRLAWFFDIEGQARLAHKLANEHASVAWPSALEGVKSDDLPAEELLTDAAEFRAWFDADDEAPMAASPDAILRGIPGDGSRPVSFGPRVSRGDAVEIPAPGEAPEFYGVYVMDRRGLWQWIADANDRDSAVAVAKLAMRADVDGAQRLHADDLTVAYVAKGAADALAKLDPHHSKLAKFEGEMGFFAEVVRHSVTLDRIADALEGEFDLVFAYDIAEAFGSEYAHDAITGGPSRTVTEIVRELFGEGNVDADALDRALASGPLV